MVVVAAVPQEGPRTSTAIAYSPNSNCELGRPRGQKQMGQVTERGHEPDMDSYTCPQPDPEQLSCLHTASAPIP